MHVRRGFVGLSIAVLVWGAQSVNGQEPPVSALSVSRPSEVSAVSLPAIPYQLLANLSFNKAEADKLGMTKAQRDELTALMTAQSAENARCQAVLMRIDQAGLKSYRFQSVVNDLGEEAKTKVQSQAQAILTPEQRAKLRQWHRQEILQMVSTAARPSLPFATGTVQQHLANKDLLSVLELPTIQQALELTDDQWLRVEAARKQAYPAARALILQCREPANAPNPHVPVTAFNAQPLMDSFGKETLAVLTESQQKKFEELVQAQRTEFQAAAQRRALDFAKVHQQFSLAIPHGTIRQMKSSTGPEAQVEVTLHNAFADPVTAQKLELTETQQQELARRLNEFRDVVTKKYSEHQQESFASESKKREQLKALLQAHNAEFQTQLADLLTPAQNAQLKKETWKGLGWAALLEPEITGQLQLSEAQKTALQTLRTTPVPQMPAAANPSENASAFFKRSEEFQRKMGEHHATITRKVSSSLTAEQREQFETLTGLKLAKPTPGE